MERIDSQRQSFLPSATVEGFLTSSVTQLLCRLDFEAMKATLAQNIRMAIRFAITENGMHCGDMRPVKVPVQLQSASQGEI